MILNTKLSMITYDKQDFATILYKEKHLYYSTHMRSYPNKMRIKLLIKDNNDLFTAEYGKTWYFLK